MKGGFTRRKETERKREGYYCAPASPPLAATTLLPLCNCAISATAWFSYITNGSPLLLKQLERRARGHGQPRCIKASVL